ncbi:MAG TPA: DegV family protein [Candidatus Scatomorpha merdigallinarum]|nr:DegV family protein [Candidatus Scatomorpha merdigallinarum]
MGDFRVITDGSGDIPADVIKSRDITVINFYVLLGSGEYLEQNVDIGDDEFYEWMVAHPGVYPKSSTPSTQDYLKLFTQVAQAGEKAIVLCITEKFSNSYQTACIALDLLREDYPDAEITVINSMVNTVLQGLMVLEACNMRDAGVGYTEAVERLYEIRPTGRIFFTIGSMDYLAAGGRIGRLAGKVSSVLGIRPVITLKEGEIFLGGMGRGRAKTLDKVLSNTREYLKKTFTSRDQFEICLGYGYDYNEAVEFRSRLEALLEELGLGGDDEIHITHISSVIAVHTGPYALGVGIIAKARLD